MHLGMTGRFLRRRRRRPRSARRASSTTSAGAAACRARPRRLPPVERRHGRPTTTRAASASWTWWPRARRRPSTRCSRHSGVEPLGNALDGALLARLFAGKSAPLKAALLDQRLVAGLGNIYVCEALHRAGLSPRRAAGTLARTGGRADRRGRPPRRRRSARCWTEAVEAGGSTLRDYAQTDGSLGYFQHRFRVYDREGEPCPTPGCGGTIQRIVQSGRSTFFCATASAEACQR